jgi:hypothetical protein
MDSRADTVRSAARTAAAKCPAGAPTQTEARAMNFGAKVLTGGFLAVVGLFTIKIVLAVIGGLLAVLAFLLFTVLPLVLIGWLIVKAYRFLQAGERPAFD